MCRLQRHARLSDFIAGLVAFSARSAQRRGNFTYASRSGALMMMMAERKRMKRSRARFVVEHIFQSEVSRCE